MDRTDSQIVELLQKNGRLPNNDLASRLGMAPSSTWERVKRLHEAGVFTGFHARVSPTALGIRLQAMIAVRIARHSHDLVERFRIEILQVPEVTAFYHLAGRDDFLVHVAVRDADHLRELVLGRFTTRPEVAHLETHLVFEHAQKDALPNYAVEDAER